MGPIDFILWNADEMYLGFDDINEQGYFISDNNVFFVDRRWIQFYSPLLVKLLFDDALVLYVFNNCIEGIKIIDPFVTVDGYKINFNWGTDQGYSLL